jgi:hypothetical protein
MKTLHPSNPPDQPSLQRLWATTLCLIGCVFVPGMTGCANKEPVQITARPIRTSQVGTMAREIQRTSPGEVMDPNAEVFAQVPKRILFLPGEHGIFSRQSPEQLAAYDLVKVGQLPEVQANQPTSVILTDPWKNAEKGTQDIINMTIAESGRLEEGTARRLNVMQAIDIDFARPRIRKGETLRFFEDTGWVGWIPKDSIQGTPSPTGVSGAPGTPGVNRPMPPPVRRPGNQPNMGAPGDEPLPPIGGGGASPRPGFAPPPTPPTPVTGPTPPAPGAPMPPPAPVVPPTTGPALPNPTPPAGIPQRLAPPKSS